CSKLASRRSVARRLYREERNWQARSHHHVERERTPACARGDKRTGRRRACRFNACFERFNRQPSEYREQVLPNECRKRVAIEAGVTEIWYQYVGLDGKIIGLHQFGLSAPGAEVMKERGIDAQHVIDAAKSL